MRVVTGTIRHMDDTPWSGAKVIFELMTNLIVDDVIYPKETKTVTADASGQFSIELAVPNTGRAKYKATSPAGSQVFYLAAGSAIGLDDLLAYPASSEYPESFQVLLDTHTGSHYHGDYNVKKYGALGNGTTDDTAAIQAAIDAAELTGGKVFLPSGTYLITDTLVISSAISFEGESIAALYGSMDDAESRIIGVEIPTQSPYMIGAVLLMTTAATDAIKITVVGKTVNLKNFGIRFGDDIRFTDTGNGVHLLPETNAIDSLPDFGIFDSLWESVYVWGHDGNHYAFKLVNMVLSTFTNLRSYGGGGIEMHANTNMTSPGNCVITHPYIVLFCGDTAQGIYIHSSGNNSGCILNTFIRPQVNFIAAPAEFTGITAVNVTDQRIFNCDAKTLKLNLISPNFETTITGGWLINSLQYSIYPAGGPISFCHTPYGDWRSDGMRLYDDNGAILAALYADQLIIKSPNGSFHAIKVANDGAISSTAL